MTLRSDQIASSSPPGVAPPLAHVRIAGGNPSRCTAAMSDGSWTCPRTVAPFRCASRFADFAALSPAVDATFLPSGSATRWQPDLLGAHLGSRQSSIILALPWVVGPRPPWHGG